MKYLLPFFVLLILVGAGCAASVSEPVPSEPEPINEPISMTDRTYEAFPGVLPADELEDRVAHIETERGTIEIQFFGDTAPMAVSNFIQLTQDGYFDGLTFHRREEGFVIQGGDPNGNGTGGPGYSFADELNDEYTYERGIVAMANRGPNTNGSQFFIMLADVPLPKQYTIFGRVTDGMDVVDAIQIGDQMMQVRLNK